MFNATVSVTLKKEVSDPQGAAVQQALESIAFQGVSRMRVGKIYVFRLEAADRAAAESQARQMAEKVLHNPVIEEYSLVIEESAK